MAASALEFRTILALRTDLGLLKVVVLAGGRGRNTGDVKVAGEARDGDAGITAVEKPGAADRRSRALRGRVRLLPVPDGRRVGRNEIRVTRDAVIAGGPPVDVGVNGGVAAARIQQQPTLPSPVDRRHARPELCGQPSRRSGGRNPVVVDVDDAADGLRTETERARPAHDVDLLDGKRVDRHRVVLRNVRDIDRADAVLLNADLRVRQAAQNGARRFRGKARGGRAGHVGEQAAEAAIAAAGLDLVAPDRRQRRERWIEGRRRRGARQRRCDGRRRPTGFATPGAPRGFGPASLHGHLRHVDFCRSVRRALRGSRRRCRLRRTRLRRGLCRGRGCRRG